MRCSNGRDFGAYPGLVPRQISTGGRTILGKVSRQGNRYLRVLFVQAVWVVLIKPQTWERYGLKQWITAAKRRLHPNVLANRLARIAWAALSNDCDFGAKDCRIFRPLCSHLTMPGMSIHFTPFATVCYAHAGQ